MNADEFLAWTPPDSPDQWELIDGEPTHWQPLPPHAAAIAAETAGLIHNHLRGRRPLRAWMRAGISPDASNVRTPCLTISAERPAPGAMLLREPLVIVEVAYPRNPAVVSGVLLYKTMPGLREILVLLSESRHGVLYQRSAAGGDWDSTTLGGEDEAQLPSIGFAIPLPRFYRTAYEVPP